MYIDKLDDIITKYNSTHDKTIKIRLVDLKNNTYIDSNKEVNETDPKFEVGDHVRISK